VADDAAAGGRRPGKRERLVAAAGELFYRQGVERTTLADIAQAAGVPLGTVYYHFKAKDEIVATVIESRARDLQAALEVVDHSQHAPAGRLKAFVQMPAGHRQAIAEHGCPYGTLCTDVGKHLGGPDPVAAALMRIPVDWAERQLRSMGRDDAHDLAVDYIASYQGATLLAGAFGDAELMRRQCERIQDWIDSLEPGHRASPAPA